MRCVTQYDAFASGVAWQPLTGPNTYRPFDETLIPCRCGREGCGEDAIPERCKVYRMRLDLPDLRRLG